MTDIISAHKTLRYALQTLLARSGTKDAGLIPSDSKNPFFSNLAQKENYTPAQFRAVRNSLVKYEAQLAALNIILPSIAAIEALTKAMPEPARVTERAEIDVNDGFIFIRTPFALKDISDKCRAAHDKAREEFGPVYCGVYDKYSEEARYKYDREAKYWRLPYTRKSFELVIRNEFFNTSTTVFSPSARAVLKELQKEKIAAAHAAAIHAEAKEAEYRELLALINIDGEILPGKKLYAHQKADIEFLLSRESGLIGDDAGLGKTLSTILPALALQRKYGWKIIVVTTLSSCEDWTRIALAVGASLEVFTWKMIPVATNESPSEPFIFIADEAQRLQSLTSQQTKAGLSLAWHPMCKRFFPISATPVPNGKPINAIGLLLALKWPPLYVPFSPVYPINFGKKYKGTETEGSVLPEKMIKKIRKYEKDFCGAHTRTFRDGRRIWDTTGATNKDLFYRYTRYIEGEKNHPWCCWMQHRKKDCTDLPPKQRILEMVEVAPDAAKQYNAAIVQGVKDYWKRCEDRLAEWIATYKDEHDGIMPTEQDITKKKNGFRNAAGIILNGLQRHISEKTKVPHSVRKILSILDQGEKCVVFCEFIDTAKEIGRLIEEATHQGSVGYILGEVKREDRVKVQDDFQDPNGKLEVVICSAAGREAITLNAACYMVMVSRPWTPGAVDQGENRCDRLGRLGGNVQVTIYWMQLPASINEIDIRVDGILQVKLININEMRYNETEGFDFVEDEEIKQVALTTTIKTAEKLIRKQKKVA